LKKNRFFALGIILLGCALRAHAQNGCGDSPENPTAVLALLGAVGAMGAGCARIRNSFKLNRRSREKGEKPISEVGRN